MATPNEKLAASLAKLQMLQTDGRCVFRSSELSKTHRKRLVDQGFLERVIGGWLISTRPGIEPGDSTPWFASFWEFCAYYCTERFGTDWHLSAEQSLLLLAENTVIPTQVIVYSTAGINKVQPLLFGTAILSIKQKEILAGADIIERGGLRLVAADAALVKVPEAFFTRSPIEAQVTLLGVKDVSGVLRRLLEGGNSVIAGRLAGAFRRIGRESFAKEILSTMKSAGYDVRKHDPFAETYKFGTITRAEAPIVGRLQAIWSSMRADVIKSFPASPGSAADLHAYLQAIDDIYKTDAYNSLSIEGYQVTPELIERVRQASWNPDSNAGDKESRDALAARGYYQAFLAVKESVRQVIGGANAVALARDSFRDWYRQLFQPCVTAGLVPAAALAGYRNDFVFLRTSRYVPPRWEVVPEAMSALFELLESEPEASVRAVLGHWLFGYIHPFMDGNGRLARFLMNTMLASGGYPWTVIQVSERSEYLDALNSASLNMDIAPFTAFIAKSMARAKGV
jgi:hypothetical protein